VTVRIVAIEGAKMILLGIVALVLFFGLAIVN
jgi:hypothetical protein